MDANSKNLIVVLGMHCSGTSVITRGLKVLGVHLGNNMMPAGEDNPMGYWEDADITTLNVEMLNFLKSDWHFLTPIQSENVDILRRNGYFLRAVEMLRKKMAAAPIFGFKDPCVAKLLLFWKEVFAHDLLKTHYIVAVRHPLSVCKSLAKRAGFEFEKSYLLWLEHVINSFAGTEGENRVVVDYDRLMRSPETELAKIAKEFQLQVDDSELEKFKLEFLDDELRHTVYQINDLTLDEAAPPLAQEVYSKALDIAADRSRMEDETFKKSVKQWSQELSRLKSALVLADKLESRIAEREQAAQALSAQVAEANKAVVSVSNKLNEREQVLQALNAKLWEIYGSRAWRLIQLLWKARLFLAPRHSTRERIARALMRLLRAIRKKLQPQPAPRLTSDAYLRWIENKEAKVAELAAQIEQSKRLPRQPLISIVTPVYNPPVAVFKDTLESVIQQTYPNWELCIANGDPKNRAISKLLAKYARRDKRIKIINLAQNQGIAGNTNAAIDMATGEYVAFLDHDDTLAPFALFEISSSLNENSATDLFFSDEDKITEKGERFSKFFKPGFSPDLLRSVNYMPHFLVVRKSFGDQIGWIRSGFEGAQDYDFVLRATEGTKNIVRIPKILYHWRMVQGSAASGADAKPYASASGIRALQEHLQRTGLSGKVENNLVPTWYNVRYDLPEQPLVSIIIPSHNHADDLNRCVNSILEKSTYSNFEILIVENNSRDASTFSLYGQLQKRDERISVIEWKNPFNYSLVNNWAAQEAKGEVLLFLNNDTEIISHDWLEQMLTHALRPEIGTVGAKLYYPNDMIQHAGVIIGIGGVAGHGQRGYARSSRGHFGQLIQVRNVAANTAACVMVRRQVFEEVNGFDEKYIVLFGDVDFCLKIHEKGYLNLWTPYAELYHHESKTRGYEETPEKLARANREGAYFKHKWAAWLQKGDPYYNPNLSLVHEDFRLS